MGITGKTRKIRVVSMCETKKRGLARCVRPALEHAEDWLKRPALKHESAASGDCMPVGIK